jgi:sulfite exporter TauE/SafE
MTTDPALPITTVAALGFGLATSLHCVGMCGPLACGLGSLAKSEGGRLTAATIYHGSRLLAYAVIGAVCGALGQQPLKWFFNSPAVLLPWVLVAVLLVMAAGWDKKIPRPAILNRLTARARLRAGKFSACGAAMAMGLLTPFLPCGPLYLAFGAALLAGSAAKGAEFALAFGLGTVPLLWLAQHQFHRIRNRLSPPAMARLRRGLALVTALVLAWRIHGTLPPALYGSPPEPATQELPSCCH